jgi:hypothetical protein
MTLLLVGVALGAPVEWVEGEDTGLDTEPVVHPPPPAFHCSAPCGPDAQWVVNIPDLDTASVTPQTVTVTPPIAGTAKVHPSGFQITGRKNADDLHTLRINVRDRQGNPVVRTHTISTGPYVGKYVDQDGRDTIAYGEPLIAYVAGVEAVHLQVRRVASHATTVEAPGPVIEERTVRTDLRRNRIELPPLTAGTYVVRLTADGGVRPSTKLVRVTGLQVDVFSDVAQRVVRVRDVDTQRPSRTARVEGKKPDRHGVVRLKPGTEPVEVHHGQEVVVVPLRAHPSGEAAMTGKLWEAQGTYRPGDTLAIRGLFRSRTAGASGNLTFPGAGTASYVVQIGLFVREGEVTVSPTGTFAFDIKLPSDLAVPSFGLGSVGVRLGEASVAANVFLEKPNSRPRVPDVLRQAPPLHARVESEGTGLHLELRRPPGSTLAHVAVTRFGAVELFTVDLSSDRVRVPLTIDGDQVFDVAIDFTGNEATSQERLRYTPQPLSIVKAERPGASIVADVAFAGAKTGEVVAWITADRHAVATPFEWSNIEVNWAFWAPRASRPAQQPGPLRVVEASFSTCNMPLGPVAWKLPPTDRVGAMSSWVPLARDSQSLRLPADPAVDYILHVVGHDGAGRVAHAQRLVPATPALQTASE